MANKQWKKFLSVLLCVAIMMSCNPEVFALTIDYSKGTADITTDKEQEKIDARVNAVMQEIDKIGAVEYTDSCLSKIDKAETAYNNLSDELKEQVINYNVLKYAKSGYEVLEADAQDTSSYTIEDSGVINSITWTVYTNGLLEISGEGTVPSYSTGGAPWYSYASSITSILVRSSITGIGLNAFYGCNNVIDITLPFVGESRSATRYKSAFGYIFGYTTKGSGSSVTSSGYAVGDIYCISSYYGGNQYVTSVNGSNISYSECYVYNVPSSIKSVYITDATRIPGGAFSFCSSITKVVLNEGISSIGDYAFYGSGIKNFTIPDTVSAIGKYSFYNCKGLTEVFIPNAVTIIPAHAFYGCSNISRLVLSSNTTSIGDYAFSGCSGFTKIVIPDKTKSIGSYAFNGCSLAKTLSIGSRLEKISSYAFQNCTGLISINISKNVTYIGVGAFEGCSNITDVTLPFVGESRSATGYKGQFGYIFGYSSSSDEIADWAFDEDDFASKYGYRHSYSSYDSKYGIKYYYYYEFKVPSSINSVTITDATKLEKGAFQNCSNVSRIVLNDGITFIGKSAFYSSGIKDFAIPKSVSTIEEYAFYECTGITEIFIPNAVTTIPAYTFYGCSNISRLVLSSNTTSIGDYAFSGCSGFTKIVIPDKTECIGSYAFSGCSKIDSVDIPDSVTTIGERAFDGCSSVKTLSIGSRLEKISSYAFRNCTGLTSINIPKNVTYIGACAFQGCSNITDVTSPFVGESRSATGYKGQFGYIFGYSSSSDGIADWAFDEDDFASEYGYRHSYKSYNSKYDTSYYYYYEFNVPSSINSVTITDATKLEKGAFQNCSNISRIVLNDNITSIGYYAFYNNPWYRNLTDEFVVVGDNVLVKYNGTSDEVIIPDAVKHIAGGVFRNNTTISSVTLPNELLSIGSCAFYGCSNLTKMTIPKSVVKIGGNAIPSTCEISVYQPSAGYDYRSTNRIVLNNFFTTGNETFYYVVNEDGCAEIIGCTTTSTELTVPTEIDGIVVNKIGDYGFSGCTTLNSITIPSNIKNIGRYAFNECTGLVNATIPTTVDTVGDYAFNNCTGLVNVTISEGVQALGEGAFYNCTSLSEAVIPDTVAYIGSYTFYNCTSMVTATIGTIAESVGDYTFYNCSSLENVVIGYSVKTIGDYAFYGCALGRISIPTATTSIGRYAFAENTQMTRATLRKNLLTIGDGAFRNCGLLATVNIPTTVTYIGIEAFENCASISSITIPVGVTEINDRAFSNCSSLASVTVKGDVTRIGISAFYNNAFANFILPATVKIIDDSAFRHCVNLSEVTIPTAVTTIGDAAFIDCSALSNVSMPDSVSDVGNGVFFFNNDLTIYIRKNTGTVPDNMLELQGMAHVVLEPEISAIGNNTFAYCYSLETVTYSDETVSNGKYKFSTALKTIGSEAFKDNPKLRNFIIPDSIESIGTNVFYNVVQSGYHCKDVPVTFYYVNGVITENILDSQYVWHIYVGDRISTIGEKAFYNCKVLKTISLPDTVSTIGDKVFAESDGDVVLFFRGVDGTVDASVCDGKLDGVAHLVVDKGVKTIANNAFSNNPLLIDLIIIDATTIGDYAFYNDIAINRITIDSQLYHIGEHAFDSCKSIPEVVLPETVREIGAYAFYDCNSMESINIPDGVTAINEYTFFGCASILDIVLPDSVLYIGDYAYYGCVASRSVDLGNKLNSIGAYAFYNCNQVKAIKLPNTLNSIGNYAFRSCSSITEINIPNSVIELGECVFYACTGLKKAKFGIGITEIGNSVFYGCIKLNEVILNGNVEYIHDLAFYGAEDTLVYSYENQYVEDYCYDMGLEYCEMAKWPIQETINSEIDYANFIIRTSVQGCNDISEIIGKSQSAIIVATPSYEYNELKIYGTGTTIAVFDGDNFIGEFTVVVDCDINGDSVVDVLDSSQMALASSGKKTLDGAYALAADSNQDDIIDISDYQDVVNKAVS